MELRALLMSELLWPGCGVKTPTAGDAPRSSGLAPRPLATAAAAALASASRVLGLPAAVDR